MKISVLLVLLFVVFTACDNEKSKEYVEIDQIDYSVWLDKYNLLSVFIFDLEYIRNNSVLNDSIKESINDKISILDSFCSMSDYEFDGVRIHITPAFSDNIKCDSAIICTITKTYEYPDDYDVLWERNDIFQDVVYLVRRNGEIK